MTGGNSIPLIRAGIPLICAGGTAKRAELRIDGGIITKFAGGGKRKLSGIASTQNVDRAGDIVVTAGGTWETPLPLLWQHDHERPIGWVRNIEARPNGLWIDAELADGVGQADTAWDLVQSDLVNGFSIGFRSKPSDTQDIPGGGKRFNKWQLLEVSLVTIPANADARIRRGAIRLHTKGKA